MNEESMRFREETVKGLLEFLAAWKDDDQKMCVDGRMEYEWLAARLVDRLVDRIEDLERRVTALATEEPGHGR